MDIVCLDLEGVLVPEIWIAFAEASGIPELKRTTRDEPDYDKLMESIKVLHLEDNKNLYNDFEIPEEEVAATDDKEEIPEFLQGEKVEHIE